MGRFFKERWLRKVIGLNRLFTVSLIYWQGVIFQKNQEGQKKEGRDFPKEGLLRRLFFKGRKLLWWNTPTKREFLLEGKLKAKVLGRNEDGSLGLRNPNF